mgnify:CR=1 FL=1
MKKSLFFGVLAILAASLNAAEKPIDIGSRRELFVDQYLIQKMFGLELQLHQPVRREIVLTAEAPHEHSNVIGGCIVQYKDLYYLYYRAGGRVSVANDPDTAGTYNLCVATSKDGIHWERPELNIFPDGSNVVLTADYCINNVDSAGGNMMPAGCVVTLDTNPECPAEERFKMLATSAHDGNHNGGRKFHLLTSGDGFHFTPRDGKGVPLDISNHRADSMNAIAFDHNSKEYLVYSRTWDGELRCISLNRSKDLKTFTPIISAKYSDDNRIALYHNGVVNYPRAPHILLGFPTRYDDDGANWTESVLYLPQLDERFDRAKLNPRYGTAVTDIIFMASRDGENFERYRESFVRPGPEQQRSWVYGDNEFVHGLVTTRSDLGNDAPDELSLYAVTGYWQSGCAGFRRFTLRMDGFVSLHAKADWGMMTTKPFIFKGERLSLNVSTSAAGRVNVGFYTLDDKPVPGYSLSDCVTVRGDSTDLTVRWKGVGSDLGKLSGKPVIMKIKMCDADVYSFQFTTGKDTRTLPELPAK